MLRILKIYTNSSRAVVVALIHVNYIQNNSCIVMCISVCVCVRARYIYTCMQAIRNE